MKIRGGDADSVAEILALLDGAVAWLVSQGRTGQWGTEPWSGRPAAVARLRETARECVVRLAVDEEGRTVGACVLAEEAPDHAPAVAERELYVRWLLTDRSRKGAGIGAALVADAVEETRARGISLLRVDCYAGGDRALVEQYVRLGFTPTEAFELDRPEGPWPGQVLEIRL
ncbi:GNAT family N-acetyltransferase [Kitasatospora camelliae]|uniref:GNAT family N-acetyltransferase n=1 Tax=Kitasatospora camelliae TaxID=3156397 RepID=A0AAU8K0W6_9ACTN